MEFDGRDLQFGSKHWQVDSSNQFKEFEVLNIIISIIGILGNLSICVMIIKEPTFRKPTYYCILSVAMADLLTCVLEIFFDNSAVRQLEESTLVSDNAGGRIFCNLFSWPYAIFRYAGQISIYTRVSVAIERYITLTSLDQPTGFITLTNKQTIVLISLAWFLGTVCFSYVNNVIIIRSIEEGKCHLTLSKEIAHGIWFFLISYLVPVLIVVVVYGRVIYVLKNKINTESMGIVESVQFDAAIKKITSILIAMSVAFIVLWFPESVVFLLLHTRVIDTPKYNLVNSSVHFISQINSSINPIIYFIGFNSFRQTFKKIFYSPIIRALGKRGPSTIQPENLTQRTDISQTISATISTNSNSCTVKWKSNTVKSASQTLCP